MELRLCLAISVLIQLTTANPPSTVQLSNKNNFLRLMVGDNYVFLGSTTFSSRSLLDNRGMVKEDAFPHAKLVSLSPPTSRNLLPVYEWVPRNRNKKFPDLDVAIRGRVDRHQIVYEILTNPALLRGKSSQKMIYLPAFPNAIVCTELPNYYTRPLVSTGTTNDLVLTDAITGCSVFTLRFEPKASGAFNKNKYRTEYFCHMNALNYCGTSYSPRIIKRSIIAAHLHPDQEEFQAPKIINLIRGGGTDYQPGEVVLVAAYDDQLTEDQDYQWKLRYQRTVSDERRNRHVVVSYNDKVDGINSWNPRNQEMQIRDG